MKLPRHLASTPPPSTGLVRADPRALTDTGDAGFGALAGLGRSISSVADMGFDALIKRKGLDNQAAAGRANSRATESLRMSSQAISGMDLSLNSTLPDNPKEYWNGNKLLEFPSEEKIKVFNEQHKAHMNHVRTLAPAMGFKGEAAMNTWIDSQESLSFETLSKVSNAKQQEYQEALYLGNAKNAARNGDIETANEWIEIAERGGLIGAKKAAKEREDNTTLAAKSQITDLYRAGLHDEARKELEASPLDSIQKEMMDDEIDSDEKQQALEFESSINGELVDIDNTPNMTQADFNNRAEETKQEILTANIDGTKKKAMLTGLEKWRRGTNEIDFAKVLSLNQEMDAAQRSGIVDPTIENRITNANLDGSFGGRHKGGNKIYGDMVRRFEKLKFDERVQGIEPVVREFERFNADDPRRIFLFHQAKNKVLVDNPDISARDLFVKISGLAESYDFLSEEQIKARMKGRTVPTINTQSEYDALPKGTRYKDTDGNIGIKN